jgi:hypothetical protein
VTVNRGISSFFDGKGSCNATIILGVLSLFFMSVLWVGEPSQQQQPQQQSQLLSLTNILPAKATTTISNITNDSGNGTNITQEQPPSNDTTVAPSSDLSLAYPKGWIANDLGNGTVRFSTPLRTDLMRFTVNVVNIPPSLQNMTLDNIVELNLNSLRQQLSNFSLVETNTTTLSPDNQTAQKIVYTNTNKDPNFPLGFKTMQIFAIKDGQIVTLSYVSEQSQYQRFLPIIERMLDSITFKKS